MKKNSTRERINQEIDRQAEELKKIIDDNYKDATMSEMEIAIFQHLQGMGKIALEEYIKKKL